MPTTVSIVEQALTRELRRSILRPYLPPGAPLPGDEIADCVHFGAVEPDGTVVCACLIYPAACPWLPGRPAWHLRQMATLENRRGEGHGAAVLAATANYIAEQGGELIWCDARVGAVGFYTRLGFHSHGTLFTDEQHPLPHLRMWRELLPPAGSSTG